ncbi:cystatin-B [Patella vulgata]|uniref:cystatin-B n=1 Tax=Patella vulgata TaxID=6465 RepID=UPI0024A7C38E|nr:cystatin-B [Patella vulgata]
MSMPGGASGTKAADEEIQKLCDAIRDDLEKKAGRKFTDYTAKEYKSQVVAGTNYFVKIDVGNGQAIHARIYQPLPGQGELTLNNYKADLKLEEELAYF